MGRNDLVCHEIERSVPLGAPPARPEAGTAPWAPCDLQHFVPGYRELQGIYQKATLEQEHSKRQPELEGLTDATASEHLYKDSCTLQTSQAMNYTTKF